MRTELTKRLIRNLEPQKLQIVVLEKLRDLRDGTAMLLHVKEQVPAVARGVEIDELQRGLERRFTCRGSGQLL